MAEVFMPKRNLDTSAMWGGAGSWRNEESNQVYQSSVLSKSQLKKTLRQNCP